MCTVCLEHTHTRTHRSVYKTVSQTKQVKCSGFDLVVGGARPSGKLRDQGLNPLGRSFLFKTCGLCEHGLVTPRGLKWDSSFGRALKSETTRRHLVEPDF